MVIRSGSGAIASPSPPPPHISSIVCSRPISSTLLPTYALRIDAVGAVYDLIFGLAVREFGLHRRQLSQARQRIWGRLLGNDAHAVGASLLDLVDPFPIALEAELHFGIARPGERGHHVVGVEFLAVLPFDVVALLKLDRGPRWAYASE